MRNSIRTVAALAVLLLVISRLSGQTASSDLDSALFYFKREPGRALSKANAALSVARRQQDRRQAYEAHKLLGVLSTQMGMADSALTHLTASLEIAEDLDWAAGQGAAHNNLGNYFNYLGQSEAALEHYLAALKIRTAAADSLGISRILINVGILQDELGRTTEAMESYDKALTLKVGMGDSLGQALVLQNMGIVHSEREELDLAQGKMLRALGILEELGEKVQLPPVFVNLGSVAEKSSEHGDAREWWERAIRSGREVSDWFSVAEAEMNLSTAVLELERGEEARNFADSALVHARRAGSDEQVAAVHLLLSRVFDHGSQADSALHHLQAYMDIQRTLLNAESLRHLEEMQSIYQTGIKSHTIATQEQEIRALEAGRQIRILWIVVLALALASASTLALFWKRRKDAQIRAFAAEQERLAAEIRLKEKDLELKNKELVSAALVMAQKNELLEKLDRRLEEAAAQTSGNAHAELRSLQRQIGGISNAENDWENFRQQFENVDRDFFANLRQRYPQLTETDLRVCAMIRLQLQTKEIAGALNISPDSVVKARYRIKKKMDLDKDANLTEIVMQV